MVGGYANRSEAAGLLISGKTREGCRRDVRLRLRLRLLRLLRPYAEKKLVGGRQIVVIGVGQEDTYIRKQPTNA